MPLKIALPDLVSNSYFPAIAAVELGFFKQEGLDAEIELIFPVPASFEALRDGAADFVAGSAHAPLWAFPRWEGSKVLCALSQGMYWFLVVRHDLPIEKGDVNGLKGPVSAETLVHMGSNAVEYWRSFNNDTCFWYI